MKVGSVVMEKVEDNMPPVTVYLVEAFSYLEKGGNTAGVMLNADNLSREDRLSIAKQVGVSETAFVSQSEKANFAVAFFTPTEEVDFCGHATVATFWLLKHLGIVSEGRYMQETKAGVLAVEVDSTGLVTMEQTRPTWMNVYSADVIAPLFGLSERALSSLALPIQALSTGLPDIIVPVPTGELDKVVMDEKAVVDFSRQEKVIGFHLFELNPEEDGVTAYCRNFAPAVGITEESATGSATGALACYLYKQLGWTRMSFEQGRAIGKTSRLWAELSLSEGDIAQVHVSGMAYLKGEYTVNIG
ncbi:PhzF family phenazine biosynthesis protein [Marinomonas spartinae]|uniref:PhzF family phenazine biosynthesis protein n=1 Tax=Marinomonas spartinae TaxID=1792290 RepID=UPI001F1ACD75|nr:PhzF family phenazine biosynthesis protein [Marinomonas spartinae]